MTSAARAARRSRQGRDAEDMRMMSTIAAGQLSALLAGAGLLAAAGAPI